MWSLCFHPNGWHRTWVSRRCINNYSVTYVYTFHCFSKGGTVGASLQTNKLSHFYASHPGPCVPQIKAYFPPPPLFLQKSCILHKARLITNPRMCLYFMLLDLLAAFPPLPHPIFFYTFKRSLKGDIVPPKRSPNHPLSTRVIEQSKNPLSPLLLDLSYYFWGKDSVIEGYVAHCKDFVKTFVKTGASITPKYVYTREA